jgi:endonuclease/exonuclease/phosphatase family metal-dependent hydrolase
MRRLALLAYAMLRYAFCMKLIAWNINHRTRQRRIPQTMVPAIASLNPDVVVLTEYVTGPTRDVFIRDLADSGLSEICTSKYVQGHNGVLIASRTAIWRGAIRAPEIAPAVPPNVLHVKLPELGIDILGIRSPDFSRALSSKRETWDWIQRTANKLRLRPSIILGDFNTDPSYSVARCGDRIRQLTDSKRAAEAPGMNSPC